MVNIRLTVAVINMVRLMCQPDNTNFQHLNLIDLLEFLRTTYIGIGMFLLSDPIYDNDFNPKNHCKMHTALPDPDVNAQHFVYI